jgi:hypothetical protein
MTNETIATVAMAELELMIVRSLLGQALLRRGQ